LARVPFVGAAREAAFFGFRRALAAGAGAPAAVVVVAVLASSCPAAFRPAGTALA